MPEKNLLDQEIPDDEQGKEPPYQKLQIIERIIATNNKHWGFDIVLAILCMFLGVVFSNYSNKKFNLDVIKRLSSANSFLDKLDGEIRELEKNIKPVEEIVTSISEKFEDGGFEKLDEKLEKSQARLLDRYDELEASINERLEKISKFEEGVIKELEASQSTMQENAGVISTEMENLQSLTDELLQSMTPEGEYGIQLKAIDESMKELSSTVNTYQAAAAEQIGVTQDSVDTLVDLKGYHAGRVQDFNVLFSKADEYDATVQSIKAEQGETRKEVDEIKNQADGIQGQLVAVDKALLDVMTQAGGNRMAIDRLKQRMVIYFYPREDRIASVKVKAESMGFKVRGNNFLNIKMDYMVLVMDVLPTRHEDVIAGLPGKKFFKKRLSTRDMSQWDLQIKEFYTHAIAKLEGMEVDMSKGLAKEHLQWSFWAQDALKADFREQTFEGITYDALATKLKAGLANINSQINLNASIN